MSRNLPTRFAGRARILPRLPICALPSLPQAHRGQTWHSPETWASLESITYRSRDFRPLRIRCCHVCAPSISSGLGPSRWLGRAEFHLSDYQRALVGDGKVIFSTRAKWRVLTSACRGLSQEAL